ncbi:MAG: hypothetical protein IK079_04680, partial [Desulfovibrio sp.]|nr:hypothetical protein [Desulfovibrio sp.]
TQIQRLQSQGLLPEKQLPPGIGCAATGKVRGVDGNYRRWLYYYDQKPSLPILSWQDPTCLAKRLLFANIIQHTGLHQQSLAGLSLLPILKLFGPDTTIIAEITAQVQRCGGWSILLDPIEHIELNTLLEVTDFVHDPRLEQAFKIAQDSQNPLALQKRLNYEIKHAYPQKRIAHGSAQQNEQLDLLLPIALPGLSFFTEQALHNPNINLQAILKARQQFHAQEGQLLSPQLLSKKTIALRNQLPDAIWFTVANFAAEADTVSVPNGLIEIGGTDAKKNGSMLTILPKSVRVFLLKN